MARATQTNEIMSMKPRSPLGLIVFLALLLASGTGIFRRWQERTALQTELEVARTDVGNLPELRAENQRLRARQVPTAELARLRADHAALPRLRAELEALSKSPTQ
jgi:hypothetical protein